MSSSPPTARQVHANNEATRTERTHSERSNPSAADSGTSHLFGARGPIEDRNPTVPHTVSSGPPSQQGSGIADVVLQEQNVRGMEIGTHHHTGGVTSVGAARREGSAS